MASAHSEKTAMCGPRATEGELESLVPLIAGLEEKESEQLGCMMRSLILLTLGVGFLSTVTKATDQVDFNQFAEPLRRALAHQAVPRGPRFKSNFGDCNAGADLGAHQRLNASRQRRRRAHAVDPSGSQTFVRNMVQCQPSP